MSRKTFVKKEERDTTAVKSAGRNDLMQRYKSKESLELNKVKSSVRKYKAIRKCSGIKKAA